MFTPFPSTICYTHRVAISNHRLVAFKEDRVSFRWKDYACSGKHKIMTLSADEFLRRFLIHVLPKGIGPHPPLRSLRQPQTSRITSALPGTPRHHGATATACAKQPTSLPAVLG
jgi:hypothetical protein